MVVQPEAVPPCNTFQFWHPHEIDVCGANVSMLTVRNYTWTSCALLSNSYFIYLPAWTREYITHEAVVVLIRTMLLRADAGTMLGGDGQLERNVGPVP